MAGKGLLIRVCAAGLLSITVLTGSLSGCSSSDNAGHQARLSASEDRQHLRREVERYREHLAAGQRESAAKDDEIARLQKQVGLLQVQVDTLSAANAELVSRRPRLDEAATETLVEFAGFYGEMVSFDESRSALLIRSDLSFDRGTDTLTREADSLLSSLAAALNRDHAAALDVRVIVHGDAKPVPEPAASAADLGRGTWDLTNRQALAIGRALAAAGLSSDRLTVAGQGARHPLASNLTAAGRSANRRVEIYLFPRGDTATGSAGPAQAAVELGAME